MQYTIGTLSQIAGCASQTIRYYEKIGLLSPSMRTNGNQRRFNSHHIEQLTFIRHGRELGFSLDVLRELLDLTSAPQSSCGAADSIARRHLEEVNSRLERLNALKIELERMIDECMHNQVASCRVLEVLSNHALCNSHSH
ncbi:MAG: helix-turn-helix domain-containing protein [Pseudomonadales bacterium]|nr:helix-turn-helix domain-containing protein [Pseudomonadales bacterium]